jgi:hypothetical protein
MPSQMITQINTKVVLSVRALRFADTEGKSVGIVSAPEKD